MMSRCNNCKEATILEASIVVEVVQSSLAKYQSKLLALTQNIALAVKVGSVRTANPRTRRSPSLSRCISCSCPALCR